MVIACLGAPSEGIIGGEDYSNRQVSWGQKNRKHCLFPEPLESILICLHLLNPILGGGHLCVCLAAPQEKLL